jgi:putative ABC transport system permease protein
MKRILRYLRGRDFNRDLKDEIDAHFEEKVDDLADGGLTTQAARARAARDFGNRTRIAELSREQWTLGALEEAGQDLRYAARVLRNDPGFTSIAILSLALGIGANTVVFSAVDHVLLQSLPYPDSDRLFSVQARSSKHDTEPMQVSAGDFYDWQAESHTFASLSAYGSWPLNLTNVDQPRRLDSQLVSANFFSTLGVRADIGRTFLPGEDQEKAPAVVVLSHHLWQAMGAPQQIIGRQVDLNGAPATIVGVMSADFAFPSVETDAWVPLALNTQNRANREGGWLRVIGKLAENRRGSEAVTEMNILSGRLAAEYPATNAGRSALPIPLRDEIVGKARPLLIVMESVAIVLLVIACTNLTSLLLAKGASRSREIALRRALGAGRVGIVRQLLVECALLAAIGGGFAILLAIEGIRLVRVFGSGMIPRASEIQLSGPIVIFAVAITAMTSLILGLVPALASTGADLRTQINSGARGIAKSVELKRGLLVAIQVGLASVLLACAGLLIQSLIRLLSVSPGFRTDHALSVRLRLSPSQYPTNQSQGVFFEELNNRTQDLPGVLAAGEISETPLKGNNPTFEFVVAGVSQKPSDPPVHAGLRAMNTSYLNAAAIPLLRGRNFTVDDARDSPPVAIVNHTMAHRLWPASDALGQRVRFKEERRWITIVGVVGDTKHNGLNADEGAVIYIPYAQKTQEWLAWTTLLVRTEGDPIQFVPAVRNVVRSLDKSQPLAEIETMDGILDRSTTIPRFTTAIIAFGAGLALLIAIVGVYGLLAYTLARRTPEMGIRLALGASPGSLSWLLISEAMPRVFLGIVVGLICVWRSALWLQPLLFGVQPHDRAILAGVAVLLVLVSLGAILIRARRVWMIDPTIALRAE